MTDPPSSPPPPASRSLWKPIVLTLAWSLFLGLSTCAGGLLSGKNPHGLGRLLLYAGMLFLGLFWLTLCFAVIYFFVWLIQKAVSR